MADTLGYLPFSWRRRKWRAFCSARRACLDLNPGGLRRMAEEIRALAEAARRVCPPERRLQSRIRGIRDEMDRLARLSVEPEFRLLAPEKRQLLRRGLRQSREQLLAAMGQTPPQSRYLQ